MMNDDYYLLSASFNINKQNNVRLKNRDGKQNLNIERDNLELLRILQKFYANKIKLLYFYLFYNTS